MIISIIFHHYIPIYPSLSPKLGMIRPVRSPKFRTSRTKKGSGRPDIRHFSSTSDSTPCVAWCLFDDAWKKPRMGHDGTEHKHTYPRFVLIPNVPSISLNQSCRESGCPIFEFAFFWTQNHSNPWVCDFFFFFFFFLSWQRLKLMTHDQQMAPGWQKMSLPHVQVAIYKDLVPITHWTGRGVLTVSYPNTMSR